MEDQDDLEKIKSEVKRNKKKVLTREEDKERCAVDR